MKRLLDLNPCGCRWPVGEDEDGRVQGVKATGMDVLHAPVDKLISGSPDTRKFEAPLRMFEPA